MFYLFQFSTLTLWPSFCNSENKVKSSTSLVCLDAYFFLTDAGTHRCQKNFIWQTEVHDVSGATNVLCNSFWLVT